VSSVCGCEQVAYLTESDDAEADAEAAHAELLRIFPLRVRVPQQRCLDDLAGCQRGLVEALGLQLGGPRTALPNDAL
jgi:hypothetical protein